MKICNVILTHNLTFHDALLLRDITHFCYSCACYVLPTLPKTVVANAYYRLGILIPKLNLITFLYFFIFRSIILNPKSPFISFYDFISDPSFSYLNINLHVPKVQGGGMGCVTHVTLCVEGTSYLPVPNLYLKSGQSTTVR